jgi:hypothetical protein
MNADVLEMACRPQHRFLRNPDAAVRMRERVAPAVAAAADRALGDDIDPKPSSRGFIAMLEAYRATGGLAPGNFLKQSLQEHQRGDLARLARLIVDRRIFVLDWRGDSWIPMFQFDVHDLSCKAAPALVRAELTGLFSGWAVAAWFAQPNALLEGRRPVNLMESDLAPVLHAARSLAPVAGLPRRALAPA